MEKLHRYIIFAAIAAAVLVAIGVTVAVTVDGGTDEVVDGGATTTYRPSPENPITFDEFLSKSFARRSFRGSWSTSNPSSIVWEDKDGNLVSWDLDSNETTVIVSNSTMNMVSPTATFVSFSPIDQNLLLFYDNVEPIWRHSFHANYVILNLTAEEIFPIRPLGHANDTKLRYAEWRPGTSEIVFSFENDIHLYKTESEIIELTTNGAVDEIYNGVPDWVYEEEVLGTNKAMHWNEDGSYLAFAQFNDSQVRSFYYTMYGDPSTPGAHRYSEQIELPYPKTGSANPTVKIFVKDVRGNPDGAAMEVIPPPGFDVDEDYIYFRIYWITSQTLGVIWMNRVQNQSETTECEVFDAVQWNCSTVFSKKEDHGWLLIQEPLYRNEKGDFLQILPRTFNELNYQHVAYISTGSSRPIFVSNGDMMVTKILKWKEDYVYFVATEEGEPGTRQLYRGSISTQGSKCLTCEVNKPRCRFNDFYISENVKYYVQACQGPDLGDIVVRNMEDHTVKAIIDEFADLRASLAEKNLPQKMFLKINVTSTFTAPVVLTLPSNYDASASKRYPVIVYVYGGPESQEVDMRFGVDWAEFLVTNYEVVYVSIDGRGTGFQSNDYIYEVYHKLGSVEMEDQISVTKQLLQNFPFLDSNRVGIWGWSYGGYATLKTLTLDTENIFKCGIAVAPPTDWQFYDTIYTERFMGLPTPEDNLAGYNSSSLLTRVDAFRGKDFMINHGVADDNVHYQNSMMLIRALELADIPFEQVSFPEENHSLGGVKRFLYHSFDKYWTKCFDLQSVIS